VKFWAIPIRHQNIKHLAGIVKILILQILIKPLMLKARLELVIAPLHKETQILG
jgi:hypothetical protein